MTQALLLSTVTSKTPPKGVGGGHAQGKGLNDTFDVDTSGNFQEIGSEVAAVSGGQLSVGSLTADNLEGTTEPEAAAILLYGQEVGAFRTWVEVQFASGSTGQAGLIFGYQGPNDYWIMVRDLADGDRKIYHIENGSKTQYATQGLASFSTGQAVNTSVVGKRNTADAGFTNSNFDFADGLPPGRVGLWTNTAEARFNRIRIFKDAQPADLAGRWTSFARHGIHASGTYADMLGCTVDTDGIYDPMFLTGLRAPDGRFHDLQHVARRHHRRGRATGVQRHRSGRLRRGAVPTQHDADGAGGV